MNSEDNTFWDHVYDLRERQRIARTWKTADLAEYLEDKFSVNYIRVNPHNASIAMEGDRIGDYVKKGGEPKVFRVARGRFQLIEDPLDDIETRRARKELAMKRAEELRAMARTRELREKKRGAANLYAKLSSTLLSENANARPKTSEEGTGLYTSIPVYISEVVRRQMDGLEPEEKAERIVCTFIKQACGDATEVEKDRNGVDLRVTIDGYTTRIEVKGTESDDIWKNLVVSSQKQHDALVSGDVEIYRVVGVNSANPFLYILEYGNDFILEPEPRWKVKPAQNTDQRYPLRGKAYRYDRPFDPVALDDWETLR